MVSELINSYSRQWNQQLVERLFAPKIAELIVNTQLLLEPTNDICIWKGNRNGKCSVKSAYIVDQGLRFDDKDGLWSNIWKSGLLERQKLLLWRIASGALPMTDRLPFLRGSSNELQPCMLCNQDTESVIHLFKNCSVARALWMSSRWDLHCDSITTSNGRDLIKWLCNNGSFPQTKDLLLYTACVNETIWNLRLYGLNVIDMITVMGRVIHRLNEVLNSGASSRCKHMSPKESQTVLMRKIQKMDRAYVDASFNNFFAGIGVVLIETPTLMEPQSCLALHFLQEML
ncbi:uncharacterized protein LOC133785756 [Humulus lupulus]|uniref:uncharacterized protein LOC133785756 n=1 Tax=Humulus lupulus TaxID=3486 RepID=UPI002B412DD9|nr:uncharacterized protein LOC133785756 [Humulus lupulus]